MSCWGDPEALCESRVIVSLCHVAVREKLVEACYFFYALEAVKQCPFLTTHVSSAEVHNLRNRFSERDTNTERRDLALTVPSHSDQNKEKYGPSNR